MPLVHLKGLDLLSNLPKLLFPIMWADETAILNEVNTEKFKAMGMNQTEIVDGVAIDWSWNGGRILVISSSIVYYLQNSWKKHYMIKIWYFFRLN